MTKQRPERRLAQADEKNIMTVHLICNSYSLRAGGAEKLVRQLHRSLLARGVSSHLVGLEQQSDHEESHATCLQLPSAYHPLALLKLLVHIRRNVSPGDVIHAHLFPAVFYISVLKLLGIIRVPTIMTEHSTDNRRRHTRWGRLLDSVTYRGFQRIIAISHGVKDELLAWLSSLPAPVPIPVKVIYNGVDLSWQQPIERNKNPRPIVISVGNLREPKNYPTMLQAIASLEDLDFEYWIVGDGRLRSTLEHLADKLCITDKTSFLGHVSPAAPLLKQADIFLMASTAEGFGLAAVEAMNASLPLVISDIPGLSELDDGHPPCSIATNPESRESIASALRMLIESTEQRHKLGRAGFLRSQSFGLGAMVISYLDEYDACRQPQ